MKPPPVAISSNASFVSSYAKPQTLKYGERFPGGARGGGVKYIVYNQQEPQSGVHKAGMFNEPLAFLHIPKVLFQVKIDFY